MSRIGKKPIELPSQVTVEVSGSTVSVKGPLGTDSLVLNSGIGVTKEDNMIVLVKNGDPKSKELEAMHGMYRAVLANIVEGVSKGFERDLEIVGVGFRAQQQGTDIQFHLGFSHPVIYKAPQGVQLIVVDQTKVKVKGTNKEKVGQTASEIRFLKEPEPYKGKGIRFKDENVRRKAGKTGKK
ncbi:MAG: 50S ribosomal protein L6 [Spirochaetota bacterium]